MLALAATVAVYVFMEQWRPFIILGGTVFAVGWCWMWLTRRHPMIALTVFGFLRGLLGPRR